MIKRIGALVFIFVCTSDAWAFLGSTIDSRSHLLLAYLVDHISIHPAFGICSLVSVGLVVSYLRLVAGIRFAAGEAYAFFYKTPLQAGCYTRGVDRRLR